MKMITPISNRAQPAAGDGENEAQRPVSDATVSSLGRATGTKLSAQFAELRNAPPAINNSTQSQRPRASIPIGPIGDIHAPSHVLPSSQPIDEVLIRECSEGGNIADIAKRNNIKDEKILDAMVHAAINSTHTKSAGSRVRSGERLYSVLEDSGIAHIGDRVKSSRNIELLIDQALSSKHPNSAGSAARAAQQPVDKIVSKFGLDYGGGAYKVEREMLEIKLGKITSPAILKALRDGEEGQALVDRLRLSAFSDEIKSTVLAIEQEKQKAREQKWRETYPDTPENTVLVGRSAIYDPPAAALRRGTTLDAVIKEFDCADDAQEVARLTALAKGGLRHQAQYWS
jgi:hypothetical protein